MIHGLSVPRLVMLRLKWLLEGKYGRKCYNIAYNTRWNDIPGCARIVSREVAKLGFREVDAVVHSMGGIVLRWAMNHQPMPRLRRAVMIGTPNQGAWMARWMYEKTGASFPLIHGEAALQLRPGSEGIIGQAGDLGDAEVGVIAGGTGSNRGMREWTRIPIPGDNDGVVRVEETILPGMKDFLLLRCTHTGLLLSPHTAHMTNLFLEYGVFRPRVAGALADEKSADRSAA